MCFEQKTVTQPSVVIWAAMHVRENDTSQFAILSFFKYLQFGQLKFDDCSLLKESYIAIQLQTTAPLMLPQHLGVGRRVGISSQPCYPVCCCTVTTTAPPRSVEWYLQVLRVCSRQSFLQIRSISHNFQGIPRGFGVLICGP